jgi:hypothetical protein
MREAGERTGVDTSLSEILEFSALAFAFTWTPHLLLVSARRPYSVAARVPAAIYGVGLLGPTVAAFHVERKRCGPSGQRALLGAASPRNMSPTRVTVALLAEPVMMVLSLLLPESAFDRRPSTQPLSSANYGWLQERSSAGEGSSCHGWSGGSRLQWPSGS